MTSPRFDREGSTPTGSATMDNESSGSELRRRRPSKENMFSRSSSDGSDNSHSANKNAQAHSIFVDCEEMKRKVRENLTKPAYDVSNFYHKTGLWRQIATNPGFEKVTLAVIGFNAIWIGVDTDWNKSDTLLQANAQFQIAEHFFCFFFSFEWFSRWMSFRRKWDCLRDAWFVFDSSLVIMMVLETWVLTMMMLLSGGGGNGGMGNASILRMARLARLSRMARMARLLRAMPELMILIKGIVAATRSVFFTLALLCLLMYIFAIMFTQLTKGTDIGEDYFNKVGESMYTLLVYGTLMDNITLPLSRLGKVNFLYGGLFLLFVLLAALTLMNMLIGVLTEVVSAVAATEKETLTVLFVKNKMQEVLTKIDQDGDGTISKVEFEQILASKEATEALNEVDVDVIGLVDFADFIFADEDNNGEPRTLNLSEFMQVVLQFRGSNSATVKDVVNLRKFVSNSLKSQRDELQELKELVFSRAALSVEELEDLEMFGRFATEGGKRRSMSGKSRSAGRKSCPGLVEAGLSQGDYPEVPLDILKLDFPIANKLLEASERVDVSKTPEPRSRSMSREEIYNEKLAVITAVIEANGGLGVVDGCGDWGMGSGRRMNGDGSRDGIGALGVADIKESQRRGRETAGGVGCFEVSGGSTGGTAEAGVGVPLCNTMPMLMRGQTGHLDATPNQHQPQPQNHKRRTREEDLPALPSAPNSLLLIPQPQPEAPSLRNGRQRLPPLLAQPQLPSQSESLIPPQLEKGIISGSTTATNETDHNHFAEGRLSFGTSSPNLFESTLNPLQDGTGATQAPFSLAALSPAPEAPLIFLPPLAPLNPPAPNFVPSAMFSSSQSPSPPSPSFAGPARPHQSASPPNPGPFDQHQTSGACKGFPEWRGPPGSSAATSGSSCVISNGRSSPRTKVSASRPSAGLFGGSVPAPLPPAFMHTDLGTPFTSFSVPPPSGVADVPMPHMPPTSTASFGHDRHKDFSHFVPTPTPPAHPAQEVCQKSPTSAAFPRSPQAHPGTAPQLGTPSAPTWGLSPPSPLLPSEVFFQPPSPPTLARCPSPPKPDLDLANPIFAEPSSLPMPRWLNFRSAGADAEARPPPLPAPAFSLHQPFAR